MSDFGFYEKTTQYANQIREFLGKGDFDNALLVINVGISYIEGFSSREKNTMMQLYYSNYLSSWMLWRDIIKANKKIDPVNSENNAKLNSLTDRIQRLEKRMDDLEAGK